MTTPSIGTPVREPQEQPSDSPSFEQTLGRLEDIVHLLEEGKIGLDEALGRYEEGVGLLRKAYELLEKAQRRILLLSGTDSDGNPILRPMMDLASFSPERDAASVATTDCREKSSGLRSRRQIGPESP